jgi:hypothetical protein
MQQAMQAGVYEQFRPYLQELEGLNTRRVSRFDAAYDDFHQTLKSSLGQPDALMSAAREAFDLFSPELGGSPRFQALLNVHEAGDPAAFEEAFRRDSDTPIDAPIQIDPVRRLIEELAATDPGAAASVDPTLAIAYVGRLYGRPLTPEQVAMMAFFDRRGDGAEEGPPPTGGGT